jgi:hypothetical protein
MEGNLFQFYIEARLKQVAGFTFQPSSGRGDKRKVRTTVIKSNPSHLLIELSWRLHRKRIFLFADHLYPLATFIFALINGLIDSGFTDK